MLRDLVNKRLKNKTVTPNSDVASFNLSAAAIISTDLLLLSHFSRV